MFIELSCVEQDLSVLMMVPREGGLTTWVGFIVRNYGVGLDRLLMLKGIAHLWVAPEELSVRLRRHAERLDATPVGIGIQGLAQ